MKKALSLLLVLVISLSLCACGKVNDTEKLIAEIGQVSIDSGDAIAAAQEAYDALNEKQQAKVENIETLVEAHKQYDIALKEKGYSDAEAAFQAGDFSGAKAIFSSLADYKDASARAAEAERAESYTEAVQLFQSKEYVAAAEGFHDALGYADAEDKLFDVAVALFDSGSYPEASSVFAWCPADAALPYTEYIQGISLLDSQEYDEAKQHFEAAGDLADSGEMINRCVYMQAEGYMQKGYLNTAKALYQELPEDFAYNGGESAGEKLQTLEKFKSFVAICGIWRSKDMDASVRQTHDSTGLWDQWDGDGWNYDLEITCVLNEDDTATITAKANFWHYTNYSSLSRYLKNTDSSCTFTYTGKYVPSQMKYSFDWNYAYSGTLSISQKSFRLNYQILDKNSSMNFTYTYKSFGTYDTLIKAL